MMFAARLRSPAFWAYVLFMVWLVAGAVQLRNSSIRMSRVTNSYADRRSVCEWYDLSKYDKRTGSFACIETGVHPWGRPGVGMAVWGEEQTFKGGG